MDTRRAAGLHEGRQLDARAESAELLRDPDDVLERRALGVEVEDAPVRVLERCDPARPDVERDGAHVDDVEELLQLVTHEVVDLAVRVLAPHALGTHPARSP